MTIVLRDLFRQDMLLSCVMSKAGDECHIFSNPTFVVDIYGTQKVNIYATYSIYANNEDSCLFVNLCCLLVPVNSEL